MSRVRLKSMMNEELCAGQQTAGDVDTDGEMSSKATGKADDNRQQPS